MTFHLYRIEDEQGIHVLANTGEEFVLAGRNLLYKVWQARGNPVNSGWNVKANELIGLHTGGTGSYETHRLIIDYYPSSTERIPLIELLEVFAFTWGEREPSIVHWTPLMLKLRDVCDHWGDSAISAEDRQLFKSRLVNPAYGEEFVEFLYLQGEKWVWGRNGSTNAAFIHGAARDYFREFF
jgi:hypothetical protein